uniref:Isochorismatase family protein n=1 Tax=uncultured Thiotrichaceae bacterium TaxID=298394 RepID=A0A6S6UJ50_9GAMM|nr:MAG: isochorismatase family protein [uncultured Thiotrichaceae bacterium]
MSKTALLVIDVQQSFPQREYWDDSEFQPYKENQTRLIELAREKGWKVVYVLHNEESGAFSPESGFVRLMDFLQPQADEPTFNKHVHNALTESGLNEWLQEQGVTKLVVSGIRTEQCCETTTRVGSDMGYEVDYVLDSTLTFPMEHPLTGEIVSTEAIRSHTALVLSGRFATIRSVSDYEQTA